MSKPYFGENYLPCEEEAMSLSEKEVTQWWTHFSKYPARGMLCLELRKKMNEIKINLESVQPEDLKKQQGILEGLRIAYGLLRREPK